MNNKNNPVAVVAFLLLNAILVSCEKAIDPLPSNSNETPITSERKDGERNFIYRDATGAIIGLDKFDFSADSFVIYADISNDTLASIILFTGETAFSNFAHSDETKYADIIIRQYAVSAMREYVDNNNEVKYYEEHGEYSPGFKDFLSQYDFAHRGAKSTGAGILYDNINTSGTTFGLAAYPIPNFHWFRDRASSAQGLGIHNWLFDRLWWRGGSMYITLGGGSSTAILSFVPYGFNDRAESSL